MLTAVSNFVSWGYFDSNASNYLGGTGGYQALPVNWGIDTATKMSFFAKLKQMTGF